MATRGVSREFRSAARMPMDRWVDSLFQHPTHALAPCSDAILSPFATSSDGPGCMPRMMSKSGRDWLISKPGELPRDPRGSCAEPPSLRDRSSHIRDPSGAGGMVEGPRPVGRLSATVRVASEAGLTAPSVSRGCRNGCEVWGRWYVPAPPTISLTPADRGVGVRAVVGRERVGPAGADGKPMISPMSSTASPRGDRIEASGVEGVSRAPSGQ